MQEHGIGVFVDLNVAAKFYKLNLLGVPMGYTAFCTRGYSDRLHYLEFEYEMARTIAGDNADRLLFVIYGGGDICRQFARKHRCIYVNPLVVIKNKAKSHKKKIEQSIAFASDGLFDTTNLLEESIKNYCPPEMIENFNLKLQ